MADTVKVLGQVNPATTTLTDAYVVPGTKTAVLSTVHVCNQGADGSFRVAVAIAGAGDAAKQYLYRDEPSTGGRAFPITIGITLGPGDVVRVYGSHGNFSFHVFGVES